MKSNVKSFAILITTSGERRKILPANRKKIGLKEAQTFVGGYVQMVSLRPGWVLLCDEDGKSKDLPRNEIATKEFSSCLTEGDYLRGNVIVCPASFFA